MSEMRPCFICGNAGVCQHRETELLTKKQQLERFTHEMHSTSPSFRGPSAQHIKSIRAFVALMKRPVKKLK